ncbi:hypothetical protein K501DRAFT_274383 [Backusella circina FSU 941]|nr:hypothetical protein K501DRAFT_274383 [Backusella circina FSU 941]
MNIKYISTLFFLGFLISLSVLVSAQEVVSRDQVHDIDLVRRARGQSSASTSAETASSTGHSSAKSTTTTTTTTHGGQNTSTFASPAILENGTLFYISISVTCLLWVTGKTIDVLTDRLDEHAEATAHKI